MASRALLLVIVTWGFAWVWSADQSYQSQILASRKPRFPTIAHPQSKARTVRAARVRAMAGAVAPAAKPEIRRLPIGSGLAAGEYRLTAPNGDVRILELVEGRLSAVIDDAGPRERNVAPTGTMSSGGVPGSQEPARWLLIRVQEPSARESVRQISLDDGELRPVRR